MTRFDFYKDVLALTVARIGLERAYTDALAKRQPPSLELAELAAITRAHANSLGLKAHAELTRQHVDAKRRAGRWG